MQQKEEEEEGERRRTEIGIKNFLGTKINTGVILHHF